MTTLKPLFPIVEIDCRHWSNEKRAMFMAVQRYVHESIENGEEQLDLETELAVTCLGISLGFYPNLSDDDREVLCFDVMNELINAFELVRSQGSVQ